MVFMRRIKMKRKSKGFTLIETMLVIVIATSILLMFIGYITQKTDQMRRDRLSMMMQQVLNAGLSYYVTTGTWPTNFAALQTNGYIPTKFTNPYANGFTVSNNTTTGVFYVSSEAFNSTDAYIIAGALPLAFANSSTSSTYDTTCTGPAVTTCKYVVAGVNIPGQNLNNARSVNYAGMYYNGACVPAPSCPANMQPQILVVPASVSGVNSNATSSPVLNPLSSFTAYAIGARGAGLGGGPFSATTGTGPNGCSSGTSAICKTTSSSTVGLVGQYWRVCLSVTTPNGLILAPNAAAGEVVGSVIAFTRCVPATGAGSLTEPGGSDFTVWSQ